MKRRKLIRYATDATLAAVGTALWSQLGTKAQAQSANAGGRLSIEWLGHMCFLFTGNGQRLLVNPFDSVGCTAGYPSPDVVVDYVMASSYMRDEGSTANLPGNPKVLRAPGSHLVNDSFEIVGIPSDHDLLGGNRFGTNTMWRWTQAGLNVAHLGGAAAPITDEQKILIRRPDILFLPVGGGLKAYNPQQAKDAIAQLNPRIVVPTQYLTDAADSQACDLVGVDAFVNLMTSSSDSVSVQRLAGNTLTLTRSAVPTEGMEIKIFQR